MVIPSFDALGLGPPRSPEPNAGAASSNTPQLVHQSSSTAIYRLHDIGYKVATKNPPEDQILKLLHEQNICNILPPSCKKRQVTDVITFGNRPALTFRWTSGISLKEWLQKVQGSHADLNVARLRAAVAIANTLSNFHEGGVVYNNLTPENVVLGPIEGEYTATFIDLSAAHVFGDRNNNMRIDPSLGKQIKAADLKSLGVILDQLFRGNDGAEESEAAAGLGMDQMNRNQVDGDQHRARRKRGKEHTMGEDLPFYLRSMFSALVDCDSSTPTDLRYESAKDVFLDLKLLAGNPNNECLMKSHLDQATIKGRLNLQGGMFYGRQVQISMLLHLFRSSVALGDQPMMATISGYPGTGKSTLVNQIKKPLLDLNGYFIEGKFDKSARPDTILANALDAFFGSILKSNSSNAHLSMKWRIHDAIGSASNSVLLDILPNLQKWMSDGHDDVETDVSATRSSFQLGTSHRLKFMFCKLIGAIASRAHPLVLFLDDLQWADEMTLDIIRMSMTDPDISHFLFLGCYRDNEVNMSHQLMKRLNSMQEQGVSIVKIKIGPIERECVNTLLSEVLCLPPSLCRPLSIAVHNKTGGIILFILKFLASLNDEGDLWFSMSSQRWVYNLDEIRSKEIHDDVVSHMTEHMTNLSKEMRMGLKIAACLGPNFEAEVLDKATKEGELEDDFLEQCVELGYLQHLRHLQHFSTKKYKWSHDQIHQAAYDLIPQKKRKSFHLLLGSRLFISTSPAEMKRLIFFIVDNMNRGSEIIDDVDQKYEVAQLNLEAGEKALSASAFESASKYFLAGLSLLGPESWNVNYKLSLKLYDAASEALFVTGDFTRLSEMIEQPLLMHARTFEDKLNIYNNLVRALAASAKLEEGIEKCLSILGQLGEVIPTTITPDVFMSKDVMVKQLLHGRSRQELLSLPIMSDPRKLAAMQFMNHALIMTYIAKPLLTPILVFHMVSMSIEHGICNVSAFAFACYGAYLVGEPSFDVEGGHRMGKTAIEMMTRRNAVEMAPRLYSLVYGFINIWKEPWQAGQAKHMEAYKAGMTTGDMEYALTNLYQYTNTAIYSGENVAMLCQNIPLYAKRAYQVNQLLYWKSLCVLHQLTYDLMGIEKNSFQPYPNGMTEETCFTRCINNNEISICRHIANKKKYVAFYKGDLDTAAQMYELSMRYPMGGVGRLTGVLVTIFIDGLIGFFFARKHREDERKWTNVGLDAIQSFRKWVENSHWNFANKLYLLEAEFYFLRQNNERAMACYQASVRAAREHRFVHEEGLAAEKFATFCLHNGLYQDALGNFNNAKKCYEVWGANALVERIDKAIAILVPLSTGAS